MYFEIHCLELLIMILDFYYDLTNVNLLISMCLMMNISWDMYFETHSLELLITILDFLFKFMMSISFFGVSHKFRSLELLITIHFLYVLF